MAERVLLLMLLLRGTWLVEGIGAPMRAIAFRFGGFGVPRSVIWTRNAARLSLPARICVIVHV